MKKLLITIVFLALTHNIGNAWVDYSVVYVNEESGVEFTPITTANDYVCMPIVKRSGAKINWLSNKIIDISKDGTQLAYLSARNNTTNIKDINKQGGSVQINYETGTEECILSDPHRSFTTPTISPDNEWILIVGSNILMNGNMQYANTDIFVCKKDGTQLSQLTYHAADDLSPTWSKDGNIFILSHKEVVQQVQQMYGVCHSYISFY